MKVRSARPEDCKAIIDAVQALDGRNCNNGDETPLGSLVYAIYEELSLNGILANKQMKEGCTK